MGWSGVHRAWEDRNCAQASLSNGRQAVTPTSTVAEEMALPLMVGGEEAEDLREDLVWAVARRVGEAAG